MVEQNYKGIYSVTFCLGFLCLAFLSFSFRHIDFGIYYLYTKSFIQDFDFNLVNQLLNEKVLFQNRIIITPTGFDGDYHPFGVAVFYAPFYLLGLLFEFLLGGDKRELLMAIGTVAYSLGAFVIIYKALRARTENKDVLFLMIIGFFATPWFFYTAIEPGNANILSLFLSAIFFDSIWKKNINYCFLSVVLTLLFTCKIESIFLLIPTVLVALDTKFKSQRFPVLICLMLSLCLYGIVRYIRFGSLLLGYGGVDDSYFILFDLLFSPVHGYIFTSPVYLIAIGISVWQLILCKDRWSICFIAILLLKILAESFSVNSGVDFGARSHLVDIPLLLYVLSCQRSNFRMISLFPTILCAFWTFSVLIVYKSGFRLFPLETFFSSYLFESNIYLGFIKEINKEVLVYILGYFTIFVSFFIFNRFKKYYITAFFPLYIVMVLNSAFGTYLKTADSRLVIGGGKEIWFIKEESSNFMERLDYYLYRNDRLKFKETLEAFSRYLKIAENQILIGNINPYWDTYTIYKNKIIQKTF